ncbi:lipid II:glycine glycyltransferase FemX [Shimazuella kribbensis]|uniref:lipid II:glycine glycyltransferase FemX n=1 Tax=Shimazuella kribbensis TaxID=139808 RepID=UPI00048F30F8|nr:peptidoglycan bridge formation glycyltransferase FemA/FemB family protein [Shimazuella kribbensis]
MLKLVVVDRKGYMNFVENHPLRNFFQYPSWSDLKAEWKWSSEFLGWMNNEGKMVGGTNVLYRKVPGLNKFLAYIPRGPLIDWFSTEYSLKDWFHILFRHLKQRNVFSVKIDPPLVRKKWSSDSITNGMLQFQTHGLKNKQITDLPPNQVYREVEFIQQELSEMGWRQKIASDSFDTVQPNFVYRLDLANKGLDQVFASFHPIWQKKINQAEWEGVEVSVGSLQDIHEFHALLAQEAKQEQKESRDIEYFQKMVDKLSQEDPTRIRIYYARQNDQLVSASLAIRVNGQVWDLYSAQLRKTDHAASYLLRWKMIQDAHAKGDHTFDFRGVSISLDEKHHQFELLKFKVGFAGDVCELIGEWDYPVIPMLHWAFDMYMKKR